MKPVAILQHDGSHDAGYLQTVLEQHDIPWSIFYPAAGDTVPRTLFDYSGIVLLGTHRSANDALPWLADESELIHKALGADKPVLGHGVGAQLMAKAMGATVRRCPVPSIGWHDSFITGWPEARKWFGHWREANLPYWHHEIFSLPVNSRRILFSHNCMNAGFVIGKHIGLQCHLELTAETLLQWCQSYHGELVGSDFSVQSETEILAQLPGRLAQLRRVADLVYGRWLRGFNRPFRFALKAAS